MINHARTLLLNETGPRDPSELYIGDEYIPSYTPVTLTSALISVYTTLFGSAPDYEGKLYRVAQYMSILHSTEYASYITNLDSRITYNPKSSDIMENGQFGTLIKNYSDQKLAITGAWNRPEYYGRMVTQWSITATAAQTVNAYNITDGITNTQTPYSGTTLVLPGSDLAFNITGSSLVTGDYWMITRKARIKPELPAIVQNLSNLTDKEELAIYGTENNTIDEPFKTFYNLAKYHYALPYRLTGILLAFIYRLEALR